MTFLLLLISSFVIPSESASVYRDFDNERIYSFIYAKILDRFPGENVRADCIVSKLQEDNFAENFISSHHLNENLDEKDFYVEGIFFGEEFVNKIKSVDDKFSCRVKESLLNPYIIAAIVMLVIAILIFGLAKFFCVRGCLR